MGQSLIRCNRDSRFTSSTWKVFLATLGIKPRISTAFYPQTDRQTERINQVIETYLRTFVNKEQSDWCDLLPMAEYAYNNSTTTATGQTPFYANYGRHPETTTPRRTEMAKYADKHRTESPAYQIGDLVMLSGRTIKTRRPSRKLDHKYHGPFLVEKVISPSADSADTPTQMEEASDFPCVRDRAIQGRLPTSTRSHQGPTGGGRHRERR